MSRYQKQILLMLLLALLVRLALFLFVYNTDPDRFMLHDSYGYASIAENLLQQGVYSQSETAPYYPDVFRPPLYPLFIAAIVFAGGDLGALILMQLFFSLLTCYVLVRMLHLLWGEEKKKIVLCAVFLYAIDVPSLVMGNLVMTETLFTLLFVLFIHQMLRFFLQQNNPALLLAGLFLALATLTRPISLYLAFFMLAILLFRYRKKALRYTVLFLTPLILLIGGWYLRNYANMGHWYFSQIGNFNLLYFQAADLYAEKKAVSLNDARTQLYNEVQLQMQELPMENPVAFYTLCGEKAKAVIFASPGGTLKNMVKAQINLWLRPLRGYLDYQLHNSNVYDPQSIFPSSPAKNLQSKSAHPLTRVLLYWQLVLNPLLLLLTIMGLWQVFKKNTALFYFFSMLLVYFLLVCSGPEIDARFRVPLLPLMLVIASFSTDAFPVLMRKKADLQYTA